MFPSSKLQWKAWSWEDERRKFCFCGGRAGLSGQQGCWVSYTNRLFLLPCFPTRGHAVPPPCPPLSTLEQGDHPIIISHVSCFFAMCLIPPQPVDFHVAQRQWITPQQTPPSFFILYFVSLDSHFHVAWCDMEIPKTHSTQNPNFHLINGLID